MVILLTILHILICLFLVIVVLLQSGKAADLAGAFGGMGSQTAFGPRGAATVLSKATTVAAILFMVTSLALGLTATRSSGAASSVLEKTGAATATPTPQQPAQPAAPAPQPRMEIFREGSDKPIQSTPLQLPPRPDAPAQQPPAQPPQK